ncbi:MAG: hypothetical protein DMF88_21390, partial [Acidobacteria bacterium]
AGEQPLYHIQHRGHDLPTSELPMQYAIAHRTHVTSDIEIVRADGSLVYIQNDVEPLYDSKGQVCGCVSVCVDVTERKRVEDVLRESDRRKDEFLATLSHELRNPLAPIPMASRPWRLRRSSSRRSRCSTCRASRTMPSRCNAIASTSASCFAARSKASSRSATRRRTSSRSICRTNHSGPSATSRGWRRRSSTC